MSPDGFSDEHREELVRACRTAIGDELRSVTYFTADAVEQLYLRDDLEQGADLVGFAEIERFGFRSQAGYQNTELGNYQFTIRVFEHGYLTRVLTEDSGVFVTTDELARDRFEDLAAAIQSVLQEE